MGIQLPILDGYEVTRQIKGDPATRSFPIIAINSHALDGEEQTAQDVMAMCWSREVWRATSCTL